MPKIHPDQPTLFEQAGEAAPTVPLDMSVVPGQIAANTIARRPLIEHKDRTSDAAREDQGNRPLIERPITADSVAEPKVKAPKPRRRPNREPRYGDSERDGDQTPVGRETREEWQLPDQTKAVGRLGVAFAQSESAHSRAKK